MSSRWNWRREFRGQSMFIPRTWRPTKRNLNRLPMPLQRFIHDVLTECDPAGTIRANVLLKDENHALRRMIGELKNKP
jgi:hypothetical protein